MNSNENVVETQLKLDKNLAFEILLEKKNHS